MVQEPGWLYLFGSFRRAGRAFQKPLLTAHPCGASAPPSMAPQIFGKPYLPCYSNLPVTNPALKLFRWTSSTQGHRRNQSVFDTVLGRTSMGRKAFTASQHRGYTPHPVGAFRSETNQRGTLLEIVYTQRGTEPGGTAGGQHMVRARAVVAQSLGSVAAHKNSPGMADIIQHRLGIFYRQLQVLRGDAIGHLSRFFQVSHLDQCTTAQHGGANNVLTFHGRQ